MSARKVNWSGISCKKVEKATSARSTCKICDEKIEKEELRIGLGTFAFGDSLSFRFYHPKCFPFHPKITEASDLEGFDDLDASDQTKIEKLINKKSSTKKRKQEDSDEDESDEEERPKKRVSKKKDESDDDSSEEEKKPKKKPAKKAKKISAAEKKIRAKIEDAKEELQELSINQLKDLLRLNNQPVTGVKALLIDRVSDCKVRGAIPKCPKCGGGFLTFHPDSGEYSCKGYMDDDKFRFCKFRSTDVTREPWEES